MKKILVTEVTCCANCPHSRYDSYYSMGVNSGWDCFHEHMDENGKKRWKRRIIEDDGPSPITLTAGVPVPSWCPLVSTVDKLKEIFEAGRQYGYMESLFDTNQINGIANKPDFDDWLKEEESK